MARGKVSRRRRGGTLPGYSRRKRRVTSAGAVQPRLARQSPTRNKSRLARAGGIPAIADAPCPGPPPRSAARAGHDVFVSSRVGILVAVKRRGQTPVAAIGRRVPRRHTRPRQPVRQRLGGQFGRQQVFRNTPASPPHAHPSQGRRGEWCGVKPPPFRSRGGPGRRGTGFAIRASSGGAANRFWRPVHPERPLRGSRGNVSIRVPHPRPG